MFALLGPAATGPDDLLLRPLEVFHSAPYELQELRIRPAERSMRSTPYLAQKKSSVERDSAYPVAGQAAVLNS
jgi:hypothetical protein